MSFVVVAFFQKSEEKFWNKSKISTALIDLVVIITAFVVGICILYGYLNFDLPAGVGTSIAWGSFSIGGTIAITDIAAYCIKKCKSVTQRKNTKIELRILSDAQVKKDTIRDAILRTAFVHPPLSQIQESKKSPCDLIINNLFLGSSSAFASCLSLQKDPIENSLEFKTIITLCPFSSIIKDFPYLEGVTIEQLQQSLMQREIHWRYVGKIASDQRQYWKALVYDCTFLDSDLANRSFPLSDREYTEIVKNKTTMISEVKIEDWFEPIFKEMDRTDGNILVHCQAGQSRSAAVFAAYLINRYHVNSDNALNFLKSKRLCVQSKFEEGLNEYAIELQNAREYLSYYAC